MENNKTVEINEKKRRAFDRLYRLSFFFSSEMLKHEEEDKEFEKKCKEAKESGETVFIVSAASNNAKCMKHCLQATNKVIDYLNKKENADYIEPWQLDGINAMLDSCKKEIPFDLPYAIQATLGMWDELKEFY